jgi:transposase
LHATQAISFQRLVRLMVAVFGVTISEGAIANILARAGAAGWSRPAAGVVGSGETSARVGGKTWWHWVLLSSTALYHVIVDTRAARVVIDFLSGAQLEVWVADRYVGQLGHGAVRQMGLAQLLGDANYAIEEGCNGFALEFKWPLLRAISIGRRRPGLKECTLPQ